jgi:hypothetical protein
MGAQGVLSIVQRLQVYRPKKGLNPPKSLPSKKAAVQKASDTWRLRRRLPTSSPISSPTPAPPTSATNESDDQ